MFVFLQHEHTGTFSHDESASFLIEGNGGPGRVIGFTQGAHGMKACHGKWSDAAFCTACGHDVCISVPDVMESLANGVGGGSAGCDQTGAASLEAQADGGYSCCHIGDAHRDEERGNTVKSFFQRLGVLAFYNVQAADAAGNIDAAAERVFLIHIQAALPEGFVCRRDGELGEAGEPAGLLTAHQRGRVKILYFAGELNL